MLCTTLPPSSEASGHEHSHALPDTLCVLRMLVLDWACPAAFSVRGQSGAVHAQSHLRRALKGAHVSQIYIPYTKVWHPVYLMLSGLHRQVVHCRLQLSGRDMTQQAAGAGHRACTASMRNMVYKCTWLAGCTLELSGTSCSGILRAVVCASFVP